MVPQWGHAHACTLALDGDAAFWPEADDLGRGRGAGRDVAPLPHTSQGGLVHWQGGTLHLCLTPNSLQKKSRWKSSFVPLLATIHLHPHPGTPIFFSLLTYASGFELFPCLNAQSTCGAQVASGAPHVGIVGGGVGAGGGVGPAVPRFKVTSSRAMSDA